jgi:hypothetical protein
MSATTFDLAELVAALDDKSLASEVIGMVAALHANDRRHPSQATLPGVPIAIELATGSRERAAGALVHAAALAIAALRELQESSDVPVERFLQRWGLTYAGGEA